MFIILKSNILTRSKSQIVAAVPDWRWLKSVLTCPTARYTQAQRRCKTLIVSVSTEKYWCFQDDKIYEENFNYRG